MGNKIGYVKDNHPQKKPKKLLDLAKEILRLKHYSIRTEEAYISWMIRHIHFYNKRHPKDMGVPEIEAFLTHLAVEKNVAGMLRGKYVLPSPAHYTTLLFPYFLGKQSIGAVVGLINDVILSLLLSRFLKYWQYWLGD
ncbi:MAG: hypothetical protein E3J94_02715 [Desulfobacteraceae bacterium]|nr:MAG: hypothetical protein E3J94_02715 [Desulfobacteraceae bacterium]